MCEMSASQQKALQTGRAVFHRNCSLYAQSQEAIPVHTVFKQIHKKGYSVQDALASARLLEALGFLEKTVPQKLYMGEKEVRDSAGHPITIQKYQIPEDGADIREV